MKGVDISNNNGTVDFNALKNAGYEIIYMKATQGITFTDPYLKSNYTKAKALGFKVGFYHFLKENNPVNEAQYFLNAINGLECECKYAIDAETQFGSVSSSVRQFADYLISQGKQPVLYTYKNFYDTILNNTVKDLPLWIANYGVSDPGISGWVGFQYSETGIINGINGKFDLDTFNDGIFINGWIKVGNIWNYYAKGILYKTQWLQYKDDWYCFDSNGKMMADSWAQDSTKKWFYLGTDGKMVKNKWEKDTKDWCHLGDTGAMEVNCWRQDTSGKWFYCGSDGRILHNTVIDGHNIGKDGARLD